MALPREDTVKAEAEFLELPQAAAAATPNNQQKKKPDKMCPNTTPEIWEVASIFKKLLSL